MTIGLFVSTHLLYKHLELYLTHISCGYIVWWEIFVTDSWRLPTDPVKNTEGKEAPIRSGAPVWCRPNTLRRENTYPSLKKAENTL